MARQNKDSADLFAIPDFWQSSRHLSETLVQLHNRNTLFSLNVPENYPSLLSHLEPVQALSEPDDVFTPDDIPTDGFFKLPPILKEIALHRTQPKYDAHVKEPLAEPDASLSASEEDIWIGADVGPAKQPQYMTWDKFDQAEPDQESPSPVFITEAGPTAFDALISQGKASSDQEESDVVDTALYCACLLNLALGRSSVLFSWDDQKKAFVKSGTHLRTSGVSPTLMQSIDKLFVDCANAIRFLQTFVDKTFSEPSTPTCVALAGVIGRLVLTVQSELGARGILARSILQLQIIVRPVHLVLSYFQRLVEKLVRQQSEEAMLSRLFHEVQSTEYRDSLLREAMAEVLTLTSKPWTDFVEEWIGLKPEDGAGITKRGPGKGFVKVADRMWVDDLGFELEEPDFFLDEDKIPSFLAPDVAQVIFETGRNVRFLREHHPEHPLSSQDIIASANPPKLEWQFEWASIQRLEKRVNEYRDAVSFAIRGKTLSRHPSHPSWDLSNQNSGHKLEYFGKPDDQITANFLAFIDRLDQPLRNEDSTPDKLTTLLRARLYQEEANKSTHNENFSPHWSLVPLLSFNPVIDAQSALVNQECMRLLFSAHHLQVHVDLLKQYYLMGNGLLCSRLSHALFDTDLKTAERKSGVALGGGVMGLRLGGGRENWPPASSELRLALMGVLSDSYQPPPSSKEAPISGGSRVPASRSYGSDLPGELSFAVRDLSAEEIDRCMDPDALEALDFLQLSYKTPAPLRAVVTPVVLVKYDRIFQFLLRLLRMLFIVNQQFFREELNSSDGENNACIRFRGESRHFVSQVAAYVFGTGIATSWTRFERWLDAVQAGLDGGTPQQKSQQQHYSPDRLQRRQEQTLDDIMSALLLRKRQGPVLKLLEEIFGIILRFSKLVRAGRGTAPPAGDGDGGGDGETFEDLYGKFRKGVEVFITVCKGLGEKKSASAVVKSLDDGERGLSGEAAGGLVDNPIETLVLMLDMGGFYAKKA